LHLVHGSAAEGLTCRAYTVVLYCGQWHRTHTRAQKSLLRQNQELISIVILYTSLDCYVPYALETNPSIIYIDCGQMVYGVGILFLISSFVWQNMEMLATYSALTRRKGLICMFSQSLRVL
jgi:hypothetical protein